MQFFVYSVPAEKFIMGDKSVYFLDDVIKQGRCLLLSLPGPICLEFNLYERKANNKSIVSSRVAL